MQKMILKMLMEQKKMIQNILVFVINYKVEMSNLVKLQFEIHLKVNKIYYHNFPFQLKDLDYYQYIHILVDNQELQQHHYMIDMLQYDPNIILYLDYYYYNHKMLYILYPMIYISIHHLVQY